MEKAGEYGMLVSVKVENMRLQHSELVGEAAKEESKPLVAEPENDYGFVSVCMGKGIADTFRDLGVDTIIHGGQTMNPSTQDIIDGVRRTPAKTVFVLPNNKNIYMVAEQAAKLVKDRKVVVLNTKSVPQGISAMICYNPDGSVEENLEEMNTAIGNVTSMSITQAVRNTTVNGEKIKSGQMLGLVNGAIKHVANSTQECLEKLAGEIESASFITLFYGIDVTLENAKIAEASIRAKQPDSEVTLINGGQPLYDFVISVE
jgi:dihydroxyacetone kinase-like predicted kinase